MIWFLATETTEFFELFLRVSVFSVADKRRQHGFIF